MINTQLMRGRVGPPASCKFFFPCTETGLAATGWMSDVVRGIQFQPSLTPIDGGSISVDAALGTVTPVCGGFSESAPLRAGTWASFGTQNIIEFAVFRVQPGTSDGQLSAQMPIGHHLQAKFSLSLAGNMHTAIKDDAGTLVAYAGPAVTLPPIDGTDVVAYAYLDRQASQVYARLLSLGGTVHATLTETNAAYGALAAISPTPYTRCRHMGFYGWAGFAVDTVPAVSDLDDIFLWMGNACKNGYSSRVVWPDI